MLAPALQVVELTQRYGQRVALNSLTLEVPRGEIFAFLGPNGGGKTTLFRVLSTLIPPQQGVARVLGFDLRENPLAARQRMGVVFQAPSLDKKLTVAENLRYQAALYGLRGPELARRQADLLERLGLSAESGRRVETLSGGQRRRVELVKGMLHQPRLLLLDEPSTGLDPGARSDLWAYLCLLRDKHGVSVALTTHLLEEADKADRIAILSAGELVALDTSARLKASLGGDSIVIDTADPAALAAEISERFACRAEVVAGQVRLEQRDGHQWIARLVEAFPGRIDSIALSKPSLEDVFIARTGRRFWQPREAAVA